MTLVQAPVLPAEVQALELESEPLPELFPVPEVQRERPPGEELQAPPRLKSSLLSMAVPYAV
jgi:hypothetical protein